MRFPDAAAVDAALDPVSLPPFAQVRQERTTPRVDDVAGAARDAVDALPLGRLPDGATVAVGLGSRGITDVGTVARVVVDELRGRGFEPVAVPAMGSHGGATPEGQTDALAGVGLDEATLDCPIDARMATDVVGESALGAPVHVASAALDADGIVVVNRVKPHTNFTGRVESGLCKMATVGLGKREGARVFHDTALAEGYVPTIESTFEVVAEETPLLGGVAIVENFDDETGHVEGVAVDDLPDRESALLDRAREWLPTLPYDDIDVLVVDRIGKDVSGTGMDTTVVGRYRVLNADDPDSPAIDRIVARRLTEGTHGNGHGIGLADVTTAQLAEEVDFEQVYTNALTSGSVERASLPLVMPDDERAVAAAVSTRGQWDPETVRIAWIRDTNHLGEFRVSPALAVEAPDSVTVEGWDRLVFDGDGTAGFESGSSPAWW